MREDNLFHFNTKKDIYIKQTPNGQETFNLRKWCDVRSALNYYSPKNSNRIEGHELIGMKIEDKTNGRVGVIEKVSAQWFIGRFLGVLVNFNGSHAYIFWQNIDCEESDIVAKIDASHEKYRLIS